MFWMVISPELVLAWAVRQFFAARDIRDKYNARQMPDFPGRWTLTHGYFLEMGGFTLVDPAHKYSKAKDRNGSVLTIDYFEQHPDIEIPYLTSEDIEDRSKGDALSKIIAILQTSWFIVQCIARAQQRLALTELELITLGLASLNAVTFAIWWHKPLGVQEPVRIYLETERVNVTRAVPLADEISFNISFHDALRSCWEHLVESVTRIIPEAVDASHHNRLLNEYIPLLLLHLPVFFFEIVFFPILVLCTLCTVLFVKVLQRIPAPRDTPHYTRGLFAARFLAGLRRFQYLFIANFANEVEVLLKKVFSNTHMDWFSFVMYTFRDRIIALPSMFLMSLPILCLLYLTFTITFFISFIFTAAFGIITCSTVHPSVPHVPSFYALNTTSDRWSRMVVFALFGVILGVVHCIGWNFEFPTQAEQILWRYTSMAITVIPIIVALIDIFLANVPDIETYEEESYERTGLLALDLIMTILLFIYIPVRLSLIVQALALLRSLPASALTAIDWTKYAPSLFSS